MNSWSYGFALELTAYLPIVSPLIIDVKETIWGWTHNSENALPTFAYESEGFFVRRTSFWEPSGPDFRITTQLVPWSKVGISSFEILPLPGPLSKLIREAGQTANINNANSFFGINNFCTVQFTNKNEVVHRLWFQKSSLSLSEIDFGEAKVSFEPTLTKLPQDTKNLPPLYVEKS